MLQKIIKGTKYRSYTRMEAGKKIEISRFNLDKIKVSFINNS